LPPAPSALFAACVPGVAGYIPRARRALKWSASQRLRPPRSSPAPGFGS
jgi:hypothetical protein